MGQFSNFHHSVSHTRPPLCKLSVVEIVGGGLYEGSDILSCEYTPASRATPRFWLRNIIPLPLPICLRFSETQWSILTDRGWPQHRRQCFPNTPRVVLSMCCSIDTTWNTLAIDSEFLSCSVDTGFVLALPLNDRGLELDRVGVSRKSYLKITLLFW